MFYILAIGQALTKQPIFKVNLVEANPYHKDNIQDLGKVLVILQRSFCFENGHSGGKLSWQIAGLTQ